MGSARWSRRVVSSPPPPGVCDPSSSLIAPSPLARRSLAPQASRHTCRVMSCATPCVLPSGQCGSCAARAHTWGRALVLGEREQHHRGQMCRCADRCAGLLVCWCADGPSLSELRAGQVALVPIPYQRRCQDLRHSRGKARGAGATRATRSTWMGVCVSDIRTARRKQKQKPAYN